MKNIFSYVDEYGDYSFEEKEFNDVDNLVFCNLSYLNYSMTDINNYYSLEYIANQYLSMNKYEDIRKLGIPNRDGYKLLQKVMNKKRYKNIIIHDYVYNSCIDKQFSAMMFRINNNLEYICFEGTDELISGWKEDFELSAMFPIPSHIDAINYCNSHIKLFGSNIIIGGHSKGGNLALVGSMYTNIIKRHKIKKIYNNDGPGLRKKQIESRRYKSIRNKLIHFVPQNSIVGVILINDVFNVIKAKGKSILSHIIANWEIDDNKLIESELSSKSINFQNRLLTWLDKHTDQEKLKIIDEMFKVFEDANVVRFIDINRISILIDIIKNIKNMDNEIKENIIDLIKYNIIAR